jgi:biotin carboxylase
VDRFYEPGSVKELGGSAPSEWISEEQEATKIILQAARVLGIQRGTIKCDLVLTEEGPKIIEMTCRLSGGPLAWIVKQSTGVDYLRQAVRIACGIEPCWEMLKPTNNERVACSMTPIGMGWEESRQYIVKELGKCA